MFKLETLNNIIRDL